MVPAGFGPYFAACAGVAGALIGLLFVSVTLAPDRTMTSRAPAQNQEAAANAFLVMTDAMFISLVALIPGVGLGTITLVMAASAFTGTSMFAVNSYRHRDQQPLPTRWWVRRALTLALLMTQVYLGSLLLMHPERGEAVTWLALLVLAWFAIGLLRAWELLGGTGHHLADAVRLLRDRNDGADGASEPASGLGQE